jgi:hypothetical protein
MANLKDKLKGKLLESTSGVSGLLSTALRHDPTSMTGMSLNIGMKRGLGSAMKRGLGSAALMTPEAARERFGFNPYAKKKKYNKAPKIHTQTQKEQNPFDYTENLAREAERVKNLPAPEEQAPKQKPKTSFRKLDSNR